MSSPASTDPPEAAGPGSYDSSGSVSYGTTGTLAPPRGTPADPPEALGPAVESSSGGLSYGVPGYQAGPMPLPTPEERERERQIREQLVSSCGCAVIPGGILAQLAGLAAGSRIIPAEGTGCPRCRAVPQAWWASWLMPSGQGDAAMTIHGYGPELADLHPSQDELDVLYDVLGEVGADELIAAASADPYPAGELADLGDGYPATSPELAYELDDYDAIALAGDTDPLELIAAEQTARVLDMAREAEDGEDAERAAGPRQRRYSGEERLARAIDRISQGTYVPPAPGLAVAELSNASGNCGPTDSASGMCSSRYHQLDCGTGQLGSSATGDQDDMDAWRSVLLASSGREVSAIDLATRTGPDFDDLLESPEPADSATYYELRRLLGIAHKAGPAYMRPAPAITRQELGI